MIFRFIKMLKVNYWLHLGSKMFLLFQLILLRLLQLSENRTIMEDPFNHANEEDINPLRPYQCSCGKNYKSYPALFTHIKNKHDGKPPGSIKKPINNIKKRGRPPLKHSATESGKIINNSLGSVVLSSQSLITAGQKDLDDKECIIKIANLLKKLPNQTFNKNYLIQINAILQMGVFLKSHRQQSSTLILGHVISEFLQILSQYVSWQLFQKAYTLLMLLVQFIMDELSNTNIIKQGPVDLLCDFINDFVQIGLKGMICSYQIEELSIFREQNTLEFFKDLFNWLMTKKYTNYKISLNPSFKNVLTTTSF